MKKVDSLNKQKGVVLIVSLVMLLLLTLIGVTGSQVTSLEEKMAGNAKDQNLAFQAAESALIEAESFILESSTVDFSGNSTGLLGQDDPDTTDTVEYAEPDFFGTDTWTDDFSVETSADFSNNFENKVKAVIANPRYIIKLLNISVVSGKTVTLYRITARAQGFNPGTQVILQEVFEKTN